MKTTRHLILGLLFLSLLLLLSFGASHSFLLPGESPRALENNQEQVSELSQTEKEQQEPGKKKEPESNELDEDKSNSVSTLTFNFIYYLIYKFKPADIL